MRRNWAIVFFRFGLIRGVKAIRAHKKDEEFLVSYGYSLKTFNHPKWYRDLYIQQVKETPNWSDEEKIEVLGDLEEIDKKVRELDVKDFGEGNYLE